MPRFDLLEHVIDVGCRKFIPRRVGDGPQFCLDGSGVIGPCLTQRLADPFCDCHTLLTGSALNIDVLFLVHKNLESFRHDSSLSDS